MKEAKRQRITQCLEQLDVWRASGLTMPEYVRSIGQSLWQWRTWLSTEPRWRSMLLRESTAATAGFVQVHGLKTLKAVKAQNAAPVRSSQRSPPRRLHQGSLVWPTGANRHMTLDAQQWQALTIGLPWQRLGRSITHV